MSAQETPRLNWEILVRCKDCGMEFYVERPSPSIEVIQTNDGHKRIVMLTIPNACPECKNIRPV